MIADSVTSSSIQVGEQPGEALLVGRELELLTQERQR